jgi:hypothetical protein
VSTRRWRLQGGGVELQSHPDVVGHAYPTGNLVRKEIPAPKLLRRPPPVTGLGRGSPSSCRLATGWAVRQLPGLSGKERR